MRLEARLNNANYRSNFEKLQVWQKSIELVEETYNFCKRIPESERFALIDQIKRAVASINLNIAESTGTSSEKDQIRFLENARNSLYETLSGVILAEKIYKLGIGKVESLVQEVGKLINGYIRYKKLDSSS